MCVAELSEQGLCGTIGLGDWWLYRERLHKTGAPDKVEEADREADLHRKCARDRRLEVVFR